MLVLIIPKFDRFFVLNLRLYIIPGVVEIIFKFDLLRIQHLLAGQCPGRN